jgi:hypothetical protein
MTSEATMSGVAVLALISLLGIVAALFAVVYVSHGIRRDDRQGVLGGPHTLTRSSRIARQTTGMHGFNVQL